MTWSKSLNNKFAKIQPKEEETTNKKQDSSFYDDYKARRNSNTNRVTFAPSVKASSRNGTESSKAISRQSGHKGSEEGRLSKIIPSESKGTKYFNGFQSYQERKKNGGVFTPLTVLGKHRNGFDLGTTFNLKTENDRKRLEQARIDKGVYHPDTKLTSGNIDRFSKPEMSEKIPNVTIDLEKKLGNLSLNYERIISSDSTSGEKAKRIHQLITDNKPLFDEYIKQTGSELTIPGLEYMYQRYADKITNKMRADEKAAAEAGLRPATFKDLTLNKFIYGLTDSIYGEEGYKAMSGQANNAEQYRQLLEQERYKFKPNNVIEKAVSTVSENLGRDVRKLTSPETTLAIEAAAGLALAGGQAGPQALVPEEALTVPAAIGIGATAGSSVYTFKTEAGLAYAEMINNDTTPETAYKVALGVGGVNAALDAIPLDELIKSFKILGKSKNTKSIANRLGQYIAKRGVNIADATIKGVAEEGVRITGEQAASKINKGEWAYSTDEVKDRLKNSAKEEALYSIFGNILKSGIDNYNNAEYPIFRMKKKNK